MKNFTDILQQIASIIPAYCDRCGTRYERNDIDIINQESSGITCRIECKNCNNNYMMQINNPAEGILSSKKASVKSDINVEEMRKFSNSEGIGNEEVLDAIIALDKVNNVNELEKLLREDT